MFFAEFSTDDVPKWIDECAGRVADDDEWADGISFYERCTYAADNYVCYAANAVAIIAYYGVFNFMGGCDYEDSPEARFIGDVYQRAIELRDDGVDE